MCQAGCKYEDHWGDCPFGFCKLQDEDYAEMYNIGDKGEEEIEEIFKI